MKKTLAGFALALLVLAGARAFAADPAAGGIKGVDEAWTKAILANDAAAAANLYAEDATLVLPGSGAIKGKKAITEAYVNWLKDNKVTEVSLMDTHYHTSGKLSVGWGAWRMTSVPKAGGKPVTETGTFIAAASEKDGVWKYVSDHASADPPPTAAAAPKK